MSEHLVVKGVNLLIIWFQWVCNFKNKDKDKVKNKNLEPDKISKTNQLAKLIKLRKLVRLVKLSPKANQPTTEIKLISIII